MNLLENIKENIKNKSKICLAADLDNLKDIFNLIEKGNLLKIQIFNSSRLAFIFSILFLIMTLMQPIILILNLIR